MGLRVFVRDLREDEESARKVVKLIQRAIKVAIPYFDHLAAEAVSQSRVNLENKCAPLFSRFQYLSSLYQAKQSLAKSRKGEVIRTESEEGLKIELPYYDLRREALWLTLSTIEAFFSWTEHLFIHLALLQGSIGSAPEVANLAEGEWAEKFTKVLSISNKHEKGFYDELVLIRRQLRNFLAHGAFGKQGEAFLFHSNAGAVPVMMPHSRTKSRFTLLSDLSFKEEEAMTVIDRFVGFLRSGPTKAAFRYAQESHLPTILTLVADGTYKAAMSSLEDIDDLIATLQERFDRSADMDW